MPKYKILRHPSVDTDLLDILDLIADYSGIEVALRKLNEIETTLQNLEHTPHNGTLRHAIYPNLRAIPTARKGVICFVVDDETQTVLIVAITYAGRDWVQKVTKRR